MAHLTSNTEKIYPCTQCGSKSANIVREGADPRLKCSSCNFMYDASDSIAAEKAGAIPDGLPEALQEAVRPPDVVTLENPVDTRRRGSDEGTSKAPRTPSYVFLSKDRLKHEFTTKKNFKQTALRWEYEGITFDVYELQSKKVSTNVVID